MKLFLNKENLGCGEVVLTALDGKPFSIKGYLSSGDSITMDYDPNAQATEFVLKPKVTPTMQVVIWPKTPGLASVAESPSRPHGRLPI